MSLEGSSPQSLSYRGGDRSASEKTWALWAWRMAVRGAVLMGLMFVVSLLMVVMVQRTHDGTGVELLSGPGSCAGVLALSRGGIGGMLVWPFGVMLLCVVAIRLWRWRLGNGGRGGWWHRTGKRGGRGFVVETRGEGEAGRGKGSKWEAGREK